MMSTRRRIGPPALLGIPALIAFSAMAFWLYSQPPGIGSDDAYFFSRGLTRFSLTDFSPHFPGYPAFIGLGRVLGLAIPDPVAALQAMTVTLALALPIAAAWVALRWGCPVSIVLAVFLLTLSQPLLPLLALSGLSDGGGLLFFLLFLACLGARPTARAGPAFLAGLFLGLAAATRPSYAPLLFAAYCVVLLGAPRPAIVVAIGSACVAVPAALVLYANEGPALFDEAQRFVTGHTLSWGNTAFARPDAAPRWTHTIRDTWWPGPLLVLYGLAALRAIVLWRTLFLAQRLCVVVFLVSAAWTWAMQNPENLRHLAPTLLLGPLPLVSGPRGSAVVVGVWAALVVNVAALLTGVSITPRDAPLAGC